MNVAEMMRSDIVGMEEYTPILPFEVLSAKLGFKPEQIIKLDANENPYGPSPRAIEAMARFPFHYVYPDPGQMLLREALEKYIGLSRSHIIAGNGSDEIIDMVLRLFLEPGEAIINCPPTFGMYSFLAGINRARVIDVPRREDFSLDVAAIERAIAQAGAAGTRVKIVFVCQPNNPDGSLTVRAEIEHLLSLPVMVFIDEAYAEFSGTSAVDLVPQRPNLIVARTLSKWAGLAGLRIGYALMPREVAAQMWKIKQPYNINVAAQAAALASLEDLEYLRENVMRIIRERERLFALLSRVPYLHPYPSYSNFILARVLGRSAHEVKLALERRGILIRYFDKPGLTDCVRISVGTPDQTDRLIEALLSL